jgi:hypothetical protein
MARFLQRLILVLHFMVMGSVITIVALTRYLPQNRRLLLQVTRESGVFELGASAVLLVISVVCLLLWVWGSALNQAHLMVIIGATGFFMLCHPVFRYANTQYEIREFVFACGVLYWMFHWSGRRMGKRAYAERTGTDTEWKGSCETVRRVYGK